MDRNRYEYNQSNQLMIAEIDALGSTVADLTSTHLEIVGHPSDGHLVFPINSTVNIKELLLD